MDKEKLLKKARNSPNNFQFNEFVELIKAFGYERDRINGSHQLFRHPIVKQKVNIQPIGNAQAKPYQVRGFLKLVDKYQLKLKD